MEDEKEEEEENERKIRWYLLWFVFWLFCFAMCVARSACNAPYDFIWIFSSRLEFVLFADCCVFLFVFGPVYVFSVYVEHKTYILISHGRFSKQLLQNLSSFAVF